MKISYMSDLHFEFRAVLPDQAEARLPGGDVLVLAGDIIPVKKWLRDQNEKPDKHPFHSFLQVAANKYRKIYAIAGNHEYYGVQLNELGGLREYYESFGVRFLDDEADTFEGVKFFGGTCWTDMNDGDPEVMDFAPRYMNDYTIIGGLTPEKQIELHRSFIEKMKAADPDVVISHHAPGIGSVDPRYRDETLGNFLYYSDIQIPDGVQFWIHGHVHNRVAYRKDGCQVRANPRGYPKETAVNGFDFGAQIDVKPRFIS